MTLSAVPGNPLGGGKIGGAVKTGGGVSTGKSAADCGATG